MAVTLGTYGDWTASGWTQITPSGTPQSGYNGAPPASGNSMLIYCSDSTGKDPGDAGYVAATAGSVATPYRTLKQACSVLRNGQADWLLLLKGDAWQDQVFTAGGAGGVDGLFQISGPSSTEPMVITSYTVAGASTLLPRGTGTGARPQIKTSPGFSNNNASYRNVLGNPGSPNTNSLAIIGLDFYSYKRDYTSGTYDHTVADDQCIQINGTWTWVLCEDCRFRYYTGDFTTGSTTGVDGVQTIFRRNISSYSYEKYPNGFSVGLDMGTTTNFLCEENVLFHGGWSDTCNQNIINVTGSVGAAHNVSITFTNAGYAGFPITKTYAATSADTLTTICKGLVSLINADTTLTGKNIFAEFHTWNPLGTSATSIHITQNDSVSYNTALSTSSTGSEVFTYYSGSGQLGRPNNNLFSRNTQFHNIYRHDDAAAAGVVKINGNLFISSSAMERTGGASEVQNNLFALGDGYQYEPTANCNGQISYNVSIEPMGSKGTGPTTPGGDQGWGFHLYLYGTSTGANFSNNLAAHGIATAGNQGIVLDFNASHYSGSGNIAADWVVDGTPFADNGTGNSVSCTAVKPAPDQGSGSTATYSVAVGGATAATWPAPNRKLDDYAATLGFGSFRLMMDDIVNNQRRDNWNTNYTAQTINDYFRAGFNMPQLGGGIRTDQHGGKALGKF